MSKSNRSNALNLIPFFRFSIEIKLFSLGNVDSTQQSASEALEVIFLASKEGKENLEFIFCLVLDGKVQSRLQKAPAPAQRLLFSSSARRGWVLCRHQQS